MCRAGDASEAGKAVQQGRRLVAMRGQSPGLGAPGSFTQTGKGSSQQVQLQETRPAGALERTSHSGGAKPAPGRGRMKGRARGFLRSLQHSPLPQPARNTYLLG